MFMKKHTFPNEQEEIPASTPRPEIERPGDPTEPEIPQEAPDRIPPEMPEQSPAPEIIPEEPPLGENAK